MSIVNLTEQNFKEEVEMSDQVVLIDFWAGWCGPCQMLGPIVDKVAERVGPYVKVCKVNIDDEPNLASKFGVMSIPTLVVVRNGRIVNTSVGVRQESEILSMLR